MAHRSNLNKGKIIIGLTGGIGSGKSTIAKIFKSLGAKRVINADKIGYYALTNKAIKKRVVNRFGKLVIDKSGRINRKHLGNICFQSKSNIDKLNKAVHPFIRNEIKKLIWKSPKGIIILDAALIIEKGLDKICDYLVFIDTPFNKRIKRIKKRNWSVNEIKRRQKFQIPVKTKRKLSDFIVYNNKKLDATHNQVKNILNLIKKKKGNYEPKNIKRSKKN